MLLILFSDKVSVDVWSKEVFITINVDHQILFENFYWSQTTQFKR